MIAGNGSDSWLLECARGKNYCKRLMVIYLSVVFVLSA